MYDFNAQTKKKKNLILPKREREKRNQNYRSSEQKRTIPSKVHDPFPINSNPSVTRC